MSHSFQFTDKSSQEERIYTSYLLLLIVVSCSLASLAVGYIYLSCSHLYSFVSYNRPYALKIKSHAVTRGCQFLLDVVFCMLLYERLSTFCMFTESLLYNMSIVFCRVVFLAVLFTFPSFHSVCCIISIHFVDEGMNKEGRTRLVLTYPNCGCLLHDKCSIFV